MRRTACDMRHLWRIRCERRVERELVVGCYFVRPVECGEADDPLASVANSQKRFRVVFDVTVSASSHRSRSSAHGGEDDARERLNDACKSYVVTRSSACPSSPTAR